MSQPAITQRIHKIEQALGADILERTSRATRLTEHGLQVCRRSIDAISFLERFFEGRKPSHEAIGVTGAWAAWLVATAIGKLSFGDRPIDVEYLSREAVINVAKQQEGFGPIVATLHLRNSKLKIHGYTAISMIERPVVLWVSPELDFTRSSRPVPIIEVSRDETLIDGEGLQELEMNEPGIRGVRYAGTVAGALQLAVNGQGVLVAPQDNIDQTVRLIRAPVSWVPRHAFFDLLVDERAPLVELVGLLSAALK